MREGRRGRERDTQRGGEGERESEGGTKGEREREREGGSDEQRGIERERERPRNGQTKREGEGGREERGEGGMERRRGRDIVVAYNPRCHQGMTPQCRRSRHPRSSSPLNKQRRRMLTSATPRKDLVSPVYITPRARALITCIFN